jgi:hypothetical protein
MTLIEISQELLTFDEPCAAAERLALYIEELRKCPKDVGLIPLEDAGMEPMVIRLAAASDSDFLMVLTHLRTGLKPYTADRLEQLIYRTKIRVWGVRRRALVARGAIKAQRQAERAGLTVTNSRAEIRKAVSSQWKAAFAKYLNALGTALPTTKWNYERKVAAMDDFLEFIDRELQQGRIPHWDGSLSSPP